MLPEIFCHHPAKLSFTISREVQMSALTVVSAAIPILSLIMFTYCQDNCLWPYPRRCDKNYATGFSRISYRRSKNNCGFSPSAIAGSLLLLRQYRYIIHKSEVRNWKYENGNRLNPCAPSWERIYIYLKICLRNWPV